MASCSALHGGCPSDYVAVSIAIFSMILLLVRSSFPFLIRNVPSAKGSAFWIPAIQVIASFNFLLGIVMAGNFVKYKKNHWWLSCYVWAVWVEGPLGFGLLMSCRIAQAFHLYYAFVKRRLPPIRSHFFLPLIVLPWIAGAARAIRHIEFRFDELKDLWQGILVSASLIGLWVSAYILNEVHDDISWLQVTSRFLLLTTASILVLVFFSISISQPLLTQIGFIKREPLEFKTMRQALGIPDSGLLLRRDQAVVIDPNEPLDKLLTDKKFRQSFMAFADSCLAGESVHFFEEVHELGKIPIDDPVRRIYMARHIINKYIIAGAAMEVNISHRCRQAILNTTDITHPDLFTDALNELIQLMKTNLAKDYWSSMYFINLKDETRARSNGHETEQMSGGYSYSPRLSCVQAIDDPFHHDHFSCDSSQDVHDPYP
ncbi:hypothetical protein V6N12_020828 [Hibiscus sabdariffa]|uniref:RGS domain-containing protein n=1 Tax=Hibiscus sabdariffa TaxID=183260 RepID=A0ABR2CZ95_9ROSI